MIEHLWIAGTLAEHTRGRILKQAVGFTPIKELPAAYGLCLMFGSDFQGGSAEFQQEYLTWSQTPGRALLLVPPFKIEALSIPVEWEIVHGEGIKFPSDGFANLLIKYVRYALRGRLQIPTQPSGEWGDHAIHTGYYHKHPNSGIFVVTCLPLWSLAVLDHKQQLRDWLEQLYELVGTPSQATAEEEKKLRLSHNHFATMLHLLTGDYKDRTAAMAAIENSEYFRIAPEIFEKSLSELEEKGLVEGCKLKEDGREMLYQSPFVAYAIEFEAMRESLKSERINHKDTKSTKNY